LKRLLSASLMTLVLLAAASVALAEPRTFNIDRAHSEVGFDVQHFFNKAHGSFNDYSGAIVYDPKNLAASSVAVTIRDSSVYTANDRRDNHLRTQDFFWTEKFPLITFKSTKVIPGKDESHFQVAGDLAIRGITKPVVLDVEFLGMGPVAIGGNSLGLQAGWIARTTINRKDFEIVWNKTLDQGGVMLRDNVDIVLNIAGFSTDEPATPPKPTGAPVKK
jgi:polyisoprenoid-binding protein YceI